MFIDAIKKTKVLTLFFLSKNPNILALVICYKLLKNFSSKEDKYSLRIATNIHILKLNDSLLETLDYLETSLTVIKMTLDKIPFGRQT